MVAAAQLRKSSGGQNKNFQLVSKFAGGLRPGVRGPNGVVALRSKKGGVIFPTSLHPHCFFHLSSVDVFASLGVPSYIYYAFLLPTNLPYPGLVIA